MTTATRPLLLFAAVAVLATSCGGASGSTAVATSKTTQADAAAKVTSATLKAGVRTAIAANLKLSLYVLWNNRIPAWATQSTRGPALKAIRSAAATRRQQGIRIKNLSGHQTVVSITLAASYATATAVIRDRRKVAPFRGGHRLGKAISGAEHSRLQLHRVADTTHFVVWSVTPIK